MGREGKKRKVGRRKEGREKGDKGEGIRTKICGVGDKIKTERVTGFQPV